MSRLDWIENLFEAASVLRSKALSRDPQTRGVSIEASPMAVAQSSETTSHPCDPAIVGFLIENFAEAIKDGALTGFYVFKHFPTVSLTKANLVNLIEFMRNHHYDGQMHSTDYSPGSAPTALASFLSALKQNMYPAALGYQILNILPVTAVLTAMWEVDPDYQPSWWVFASLALFSLFIMRNNNFYAAVTSGMSKEAIAEIFQKIEDAQNGLRNLILHQVLSLTLDSEDVTDEKKSLADALLRRLTKPPFLKRLDMEVRSWAAFLVKAAEAFALAYSDMLNTLPAAFRPLLGILFALVQGTDMAFSVVNRIGGQNRGISEWQAGIIPSPNTSDLALIFPRIADFALISWTMAKAGPLLWLLVRFFAAMAMLELMRLNAEDFRGAEYGYYAIAAVGALLASEVFTRYTVMENLANHMPTKRTFLYGDGSTIARLGQATIGASPIGAIAGFPAHLASLNMLECGGVAALATVICAVLIYHSERYRNLHAGIFECRFVGSALNELDRIDWKDKAVIVFLSMASVGCGLRKENTFAASLGLIMLFLSSTSLIAERSVIAANTIRYVSSQMLLYAAAFLTWIVNFVWPMMNIAHSKSPSDHAAQLSASNWYLSVLAAILGAFGALADAKATLYKVPKLTRPLGAGKRHGFSVVFFGREVGECLGCMETEGQRALRDTLRSSGHSDTHSMHGDSSTYGAIENPEEDHQRFKFCAIQ